MTADSGASAAAAKTLPIIVDVARSTPASLLDAVSITAAAPVVPTHYRSALFEDRHSDRHGLDFLIPAHGYGAAAQRSMHLVPPALEENKNGAELETAPPADLVAMNLLRAASKPPYDGDLVGAQPSDDLQSRHIALGLIPAAYSMEQLWTLCTSLGGSPTMVALSVPSVESQYPTGLEYRRGYASFTSSNDAVAVIKAVHGVDGIFATFRNSQGGAPWPPENIELSEFIELANEDAQTRTPGLPATWSKEKESRVIITGLSRNVVGSFLRTELERHGCINMLAISPVTAASTRAAFVTFASPAAAASCCDKRTSTSSRCAQLFDPSTWRKSRAWPPIEAIIIVRNDGTLEASHPRSSRDIGNHIHAPHQSPDFRSVASAYPHLPPPSVRSGSLAESRDCFDRDRARRSSDFGISHPFNDTRDARVTGKRGRDARNYSLGPLF